MQKTTINMKTINKVVSKCRINPKVDTHLKMMIELDNDIFYLIRAEELLRQSREYYNKKMTIPALASVYKAIQIAILFIVTYEKNNKVIYAASESTRSTDTSPTNQTAKGA
jgi:hypothetical protein